MGNPELSVKVWQQQIADSKTQLGYKAWKSNRYQAMQKAAGHKTIEEKWRCKYVDDDGFVLDCEGLFYDPPPLMRPSCDGMLEVNSDHCDKCGRHDLRCDYNDCDGLCNNMPDADDGNPCFCQDHLVEDVRVCTKCKRKQSGALYHNKMSRNSKSYPLTQ